VIVVTVARKPMSEGSVAANVLVHGTGAMNVEASRIATEDDLNGGAYSAGAGARHDGTESWRYKRGDEGGLAGVGFKQPAGRWPANLVLGHPSALEDSASRYFKQVGGRR
jgi:site-specific DNA-methyltransferase (adenine-specific)